MSTTVVNPGADAPSAQAPVVPPVPKADNEAEALKAELARKNQENEQLKAKLRAPAPQPVFQQNSRPDPKELQRRFFENPVGEAAAIAQAAVSDALAQQNSLTFDTLRNLARSQARDTDREIFDLYAAEIDSMVMSNEVPAQFQTNTNVWQNAFNNVKGRHVRDIIANSRAEEPKAPAVISRWADGPAPPSPAPPPAAASPSSKLTPEQREMAHKMAPHAGWRQDEAEARYAHGVMIHENQGTGKPGHSSSWDAVITTNNRFGRRNIDTRGEK